MARLFGDLSDERRLAGLRWSPAVDVAENDNSYAITVELPGAKREDVTVEVHGDVSAGSRMLRIARHLLDQSLRCRRCDHAARFAGCSGC